MTLPTQNHNLFASMVATPKGVAFESQRAGEQVLLVMRPHLITLVPEIITTIIALLVPIFVFPLIIFIAPTLFDLGNSFFAFLFLVFWYLVVFYYAFEKLLLWFYGVYIVTTQRLVDIDFVNFFQKHYAEAQLARVQDVSSTQHGPIQVMFDYGTVHVQTAGEMPNIEFEDVPSPDRVSKVLGELVTESGGVLGVKPPIAPVV